MSNKQRITKLTPKERQAASTGGSLDFNLPEAELRQRLKHWPRQFEAEAILVELAHLVAWARLSQSAPRLQPSEMSQQAQNTVAVIEELTDRLDHLHPVVGAKVDEILHRARGEYGFTLTERIKPDLYRLRAALRQSAKEMKGKPGPKGDRTALRGAAADILRNYSKPQLSKTDADKLATDLLDLCGVLAAKQA